MENKGTLFKSISFVAATMVTVSSVAATEQHDNTITVTATKRIQSSFDVIGNVNVQTDEQLKKSLVNQTDDLSAVFPELLSANRSSRIYNNMTLRGQSSADFFSPSLGLFVDGAPQLSQSYAQSLQGVEQVELLKGPQGVIYGRGTLGGIISVITKKPSSHAEAWLGGQYFGQGERINTGGSTGYMENGWAFQGNVSLDRNNGSLNNPAWDKKNVDSRDIKAGWLSANYISPDTLFESNLKVGGENYHSHEEYFVPFSPLSRSKIDTEWLYETPNLKRKLKNISWNTGYDFNDEWKFKTILSYQNMDIDRLFMDGTLQDDSQDILYSEARANYEGGDLSGIIGVSFQKMGYRHDNLSVGKVGMGGKKSDNDIYNYSGYFDGAYRINDNWELGAGARFSHEKAKTRMIILEKGKGESNYNNAVFNAFIPRASIAWLPNEQNRIWFGVGRGFKPGGFNKEGVDKLALTSYKSEIATEMELGWKWHSVNDNHMAEITLYQIDSKDVQGYVGVIGYQALSNMGDSRSRGIEYLWKSKLTPNHSISLGGMFNQSEFTSGEHKNKRPAYTPSYSSLISWEGLYGKEQKWSSRIAVRFNGPFYFNEQNNLEQGHYTVVDASISWHPTKQYELSIYAKNIGDALYRTYAFGNKAQLGNPREIGVQGSINF
ncbi:TonB-dependent receptor [Proteus mirabilis]|uniref:TonB-dependent receptor n=1 Tax=Enterobacterales TaxID=91347 RepID=UPI00071D34FD|nr:MULTISPECIES: TonB-dependent receptor [Enterobacterales]MCW3200336.1 TonB-dependent receptor [Morganella morganii]AND14017.1 TonB-dependent receptor [Proteus mirabilis]ELA9904721.1 TonB-dependent receptor [Proteus mirabilis]KSA05540.1 TonB-dependent receptor [Proteus mirabilis]MBF0801345.1 TonB-dependent receptor [Proteus mirabilis]